MDIVARGLAGRAVYVSPTGRFDNDSARDSYFSANPSEIKEGLYVFSGNKLQRYEGGQFKDSSPVIKGDTGPAGANGIDGINGINGINGVNGLSAYEQALSQGYVGTMAAWLESLKGARSYNDLSDKPIIPTVDVTKSYVDNGLSLKANITDVVNKHNVSLSVDLNSVIDEGVYYSSDVSPSLLLHYPIEMPGSLDARKNYYGVSHEYTTINNRKFIRSQYYSAGSIIWSPWLETGVNTYTTKTENIAKNVGATPSTVWVSSSAPFYYIDNAPFQGKYITKIAFQANTVGSVITIGFKNKSSVSQIAAADQTIDGEFCTITVQNTSWNIYDLTNLSDTRITYVSGNLLNSKIYLGQNQILSLGKINENCKVLYTPTDAVLNPGNKFFVSKTNTNVPSDTLAFTITTTDIATVVSNDQSKYMLPKSQLNGKKISILGDSISTFIGYIPSSNTNLYTGDNYGVSSVHQTWWHRTIDQLGLNLCVNNSWSGSRVTTTVDATSAGCMDRATALHASNYDPDIIIIDMGINDFSNEVAIGTYNGSTVLPTVTTTFREAYAIMLDKILNRYKYADVYVCTLTQCESNGTNVFPEKNDNSVLLYDWNKTIIDLAGLFGVRVIELDKCGITYQNINLTMGDYNSTTKVGLHPNSYGHKLMGNKVMKTLDPMAELSTLA